MGYEQKPVHGLQVGAVYTFKNDTVIPGPQEEKRKANFLIIFFFSSFKWLCSLATARSTRGKQSDLYQIALVSF